jgi:hypothetical protein
MHIFWKERAQEKDRIRVQLQGSLRICWVPKFWDFWSFCFIDTAFLRMKPKESVQPNVVSQLHQIQLLEFCRNTNFITWNCSRWKVIDIAFSFSYWNEGVLLLHSHGSRMPKTLLSGKQRISRRLHLGFCAATGPRLSTNFQNEGCYPVSVWVTLQVTFHWSWG